MDYFVVSQFYVSWVVTACFSWDPDWDNLSIKGADKLTVQGAQKSKGRLEANDPYKKKNPVPWL